MATPRPEKKPPTKTDILNQIAHDTSLSRKQVTSVFESLERMIAKELRPRGAGSFNFPGLLKIKLVKKPAKKSRKGINPFTGEEMTFKAKPASKSVRILPFKKLKDMI